MKRGEGARVVQKYQLATYLSGVPRPRADQRRLGSDWRLNNPCSFCFTLAKTEFVSPLLLSCFCRFDISLFKAAYSGSLLAYPSSFARVISFFAASKSFWAVFLSFWR